MGIKLDWQVESEQTTLRATEDPEARHQRRRIRRRLVLLGIALSSLIVLSVALVVWQLDRVDRQLRQDLLDTVEVEVAALRVDNFANFMAVKRSASDTFMLEQSREFEDYQQLKQAHRVELTGEVLDAAIDHQRGRVIVKEIIDGIPYKVIWYYWHYEDPGSQQQGGWRRVPDDLTFWGDARELTSGTVRIGYHALDEELAQALLPLVQDWWARGCQLLPCTAPPPPLRVMIVAERPSAVEWDAAVPWTLRVTSPLVGRSRADVAISPELESAVRQQIAARLVRYVAGDAAPLAAADAAWVHAEIARWLAGTLAAGPDVVPASDAGFLGTLIAQYGPGAPVTALQALRPDSTLDGVLSAVTGVSLPLLSLDQLNGLNWAGFFEWRLALETRLLAQPETSGAFSSLYDMENPAAASLVAQRQEDPAYAARPDPQVISVTLTRDASSQTYATVEVTRTENDQLVSEIAEWRLAGGTWKRVN